jgi:hypothetical protein
MPNVFNAGNVVKQLIWTRVRKSTERLQFRDQKLPTCDKLSRIQEAKMEILVIIVFPATPVPDCP